MEIIMIRQSIGCFVDNVDTYLPEYLKAHFKEYTLIFYYHKNFMIGVDHEKKIIKVSNYAVEYIWAWTAHWVYLYDHCHDERLTLLELIEKWDEVKKKSQIKRTLSLLELMKYNSEHNLATQAPWIIKHLNPMEVKKSIINKINQIFNYVLLSMILHELGHIEKQHPSTVTVEADSRKAESEADDFSFEKYAEFIKGLGVEQITVKSYAWVGIVCSQLIVFNLSHLNSDYSKNYGDPCNRLDKAISALEGMDTFDDDAPIYAFLSLVLWLCLRNDGVNVSSQEKISFKEQYTELLIEMHHVIQDKVQ